MRPRVAVGAFAMLAALALQPAMAADAQAGLVVIGATGQATTVTADDLARLPAVTVAAAFETEHGLRQAAFEGPLLWTVLDRGGAIDPAKPRDSVRITVTIAGRDGYTAVLALGELSPAFEGKQVILADRMDGQALGPEHLRIIVPGDRRGGRSVHDVVRISVAMPPVTP